MDTQGIIKLKVRYFPPQKRRTGNAPEKIYIHTVLLLFPINETVEAFSSLKTKKLEQRNRGTSFHKFSTTRGYNGRLKLWAAGNPIACHFESFVGMWWRILNGGHATHQIHRLPEYPNSPGVRVPADPITRGLQVELEPPTGIASCTWTYWYCYTVGYVCLVSIILIVRASPVLCTWHVFCRASRPCCCYVLDLVSTKTNKGNG